MIRQSIDSFYIFGTEIRFLQDAKKGFNIKEEHCILDNIDRFLKNLDTLGLVVTSRAAWTLRDCRKELTRPRTFHSMNNRPVNFNVL